ncbi:MULTISPECIES: hypothetical protein [Sphingobacterium]|uniref:DUF4890 domain-containing protein n=1 Tax=Sphingobacterium tenebrionis TaxID=3111775 RepID=A0ABU8I357_9SPHI|nr:hypothetical protein [Sphingobacterium sp. CZ-2]QBR11726.1 hypothetical protein E3D81_05875 [Sphingobacterium sp. CZ-2]
MKKIFTIAALVAGISFSALSQEKKEEVRQDVKKERRMKIDRKEMKPKSPEEIAKLKTEHMDKELKFTEAQKKEVYVFQLEKAKKMEAKRNEMIAAREIHRKEMKAEQDAFQKLLTPEQLAIFKDKLADGKRGRFERGGKEFRTREMRHKRMDRKMPIEKETKEVKENSSNS